ncbi:hypothetical protein AgCh_014100 [Apium graveolens]
MAIKKNRRIVFVQEYDKFNAKANESITHISDTFLTLLNDLLLVVKDYGREDSNSKFQRVLPEDWDTQAYIIRHQYYLDFLTLDEVYRILKIHYLEIQQIKKKKIQKMKILMKILIKSGDPQVIEMEAMLVKGFRKMKLAKPQRKCDFNKKYSRDGKSKFIRNEGQYSKGRKFDKVKIKVVSCERCYSSSHVNCIGSHPHAPYLCVMCLNHNSPLLVLGDSNGEKTVDKNAAKIFLAACKISAGSMKKAAVTAKMEMEARAKEAIDARELALKAIEHVEHLRRNSAST